MRAVARPVGRPVKQLPRFQRRLGVGNLDVVANLQVTRVRQQFFFRHQQLIAGAQLGLLLASEQARSGAHIDHRVLGRTPRLTIEQVGDGGHRVELELLIGVKLEFHSLATEM
jgi:hypothetical protein